MMTMMMMKTRPQETSCVYVTRHNGIEMHC